MTSYAENFLSRKINNLNDIETTGIITGDITADNAEILGNLTVYGTQYLNGETIITGDQTLDGNSTITGNLNVNANADFDGSLNIDGTFLIKGHTATTNDIPEGTNNLYFTTARARNSLSSGGNGIIYDQPSGQISWGGSTANVNEDPSYLYFTTARSRSAISATSPITYNNSTGVIGWTGTSTNVPEGTNLYFTTARARTSLSAGSGISYDNSTGVISTSTPNYWTLSGSTISNNITNVSLKNPYIEQPIQVGPADSKWIYKKYGGNNTEVGLAQLYGYDMAFYSPTNWGSWSYYIYDGTNYTVREKTYSNGDKYLWGSGSFEIKNTGTNGSVIKLYNASADGFHLYQDNANDRLRISRKNGTTFTEIFDINNSGELALGGLTPRSGYALNLNKGVYVNDSAEHIYLEGTDSFTNYKGEILFKANATIGTLKHDTTGFNINRPLALTSTSSTAGKATFTGGIDTNQGIKLTVGVPNKMLYVDYGALNDKYGFGQYGGGKVRMFSATITNSFWTSNNLSYILNDSLNYFIDTLRTQYAKTCILSFQDMSPTEAFEATGFFAIKEPTITADENDPALKVILQRSLDADNDNTRTFYTISQNVGISGTNKRRQTNLWINGVQCLNNTGNNKTAYFENIFATQIHPDYYIDSNINNVVNRPQLRISQYLEGQGIRTSMRLFFQPSILGGYGGNNYSNVMFPQLARNAYYNAFFSPDGHIYPDVYASDQRLKKNIIKQEAPILEEFRKINVVNYNWDYNGENADFCQQQPRLQTDKEQIGIIAQNLEELPTIKEKYSIVETYQFAKDLPSGNNPEPLTKSNFKPEKEFLVLNKERIPYLNMKAIQETNERIDHLENENKQLREELNELKLMVSALLTKL